MKWVKKRRLPPDRGSLNTSLDSQTFFPLLVVYQEISFKSIFTEKIFGSVLNGIEYQILIRKRKHIQPNKPPLYLYQLAPSPSYISSLYPIGDNGNDNGNEYLLEKDGIFAILTLSDDVSIQYIGKGSKKDFKELLRSKLQSQSSGVEHQ